MINEINVRFFSYCFNNDDEIDICEISERQFLSIKTCFIDSKIDYERHSVFENGVKQICLTIEPPLSYPHIDELERV